MKEMNQTVYYTTAQMKDKVELSDQNVRKYVRLLEDRNYEVAKDEHNRRLFSQGDVAVMKEFIRLAKQPGYTLETAADEIIEKVPNIVTEKSQNTPASVTNNDINHMLGVVMDKLETMQQENRELKENVHRLVEKLDEYGKYSQTLSLQYSGSGDEAQRSDAITSNGSADSTYEDAAYEEPMPAEVATEDETEDETAAHESENQSGKASNIDMNSYADQEQEDDRKEEETQADESSKQDTEEKGGYFSKLFSMFKK
ncbi:hypothetical protein FO441_06950 [Salinicoccus cyprini]|uniref:Uncharacterized protein n=1 Tax=Salinicoccus cyprini TaxID=2493691 RepID=A0A558AV66_9STAP|nr:hypothetical protein [Salinicoccus cyprini]TVT28145.1 hypothetical protein FO441_06950 [Salinicoccus cyprini]